MTEKTRKNKKKGIKLVENEQIRILMQLICGANKTLGKSS